MKKRIIGIAILSLIVGFFLLAITLLLVNPNNQLRNFFIFIFLAAALIISGFGLLKKKAWGHNFATYTYFYYLFVGILSMNFMLTFNYGPLTAQDVIETTISWGPLLIVWPILVLYVLNSKLIHGWFKQAKSFFRR
jgi:hypothetical protein